MVIRESILIHAPLEKVWDTFTDLTCWKSWSTVLTNVSSDVERITEGKSFKFCIRPFVLPLNLRPSVELVVPGKRIVWSGRKHGISARHEFIFESHNGTVNLTSKETFSSSLIKPFMFLFPKKRIRELSTLMLKELKEAAENSKTQRHDKEAMLWIKKQANKNV